MNRKYWLILSFAPVLAALSTACSSEFASCEARRKCPAGKAGAPNAGDSGSAGAEDGGTGGKGGRSGNGDSAGEGGAPDVEPIIFGECSVKGEWACAERAGEQRLACDGKHWQAGTTCGAGELCDSTNATCAPPVPECALADPGAIVCRNDTLLTCGPDLVTASVGKTCDGRCMLGVCQEPTCGDEKVQKGEDCDEAKAAAAGECVKCKAGACGDGVVYVGREQCDDGNQASGDGCSATCRAEPVELALGNGFTCARSSTGLVKCWGYNPAGQLGLGDIDLRGHLPDNVPSKLRAIDLGTGRTAVAISARGYSVCAVLDNGDLKCWGDNDDGQLGTGDTINRGDKPGQMGDALKPIELGVGLKATGISAGGRHSCAVLTGGGVKCWGSNDRGQLGQESKGDVLSPRNLPVIRLNGKATAVIASTDPVPSTPGLYESWSCALLENGTAQCWGGTSRVPHTSSAESEFGYAIGDAAGEMSALPVLTFGLGRRAKSIVAHAVNGALLDDGSLRLWGTGPQLGQPDLGSGPVGMIPAGLASLSPVNMGGKKLKSLAVGRDHACAVLDGGTLKCWGEGGYGQLGLGPVSSTNSAPGALPSLELGGSAALQVAAGDAHNCALLANGTLTCWGDNFFGQLGLGHIDDQQRPSETVDLTF